MSTYYASSSGSPTTTPYGSPKLGRAKDSLHSYSSSSSSPYQGLHCVSCLVHGDHIPVQPGRPCQVCRTMSPEQRTTGKAPRKKRQDRQLFSRLSPSGLKPYAVTKDQIEAGSRFDHTTLIGIQQNQLLKINPDLPRDARTGNGRNKPGWKLLNPNNVSKDVRNPLIHNKTEIHVSTIQVLEDDDAIITNIRDELGAQEREAVDLIRSKPTHAQLYHFVQCLAQAKRAELIETTRHHRGTHNFRVPFRLDSKL
jgi:hypothetical protein